MSLCSDRTSSSRPGMSIRGFPFDDSVKEGAAATRGDRRDQGGRNGDATRRKRGGDRDPPDHRRLGESGPRQGRQRGHVPLRIGHPFRRPRSLRCDTREPRHFARAWRRGSSRSGARSATRSRDLRLTAGDEVAFCHSLNRISGARTTGEDTDVWVRATVGLRRTGGRWMITHEHVSVPFDGSRPSRRRSTLSPKWCRS